MPIVLRGYSWICAQRALLEVLGDQTGFGNGDLWTGNRYGVRIMGIKIIIDSKKYLS